MEHNKDLAVNIFFEDKDKLINFILNETSINPIVLKKISSKSIQKEIEKSPAAQTEKN